MMIVTSLLAALSLVAQTPDIDRHAQAACSAPIGAQPTIDGIDVDVVDADSGDLAALRVTDRQGGGRMNLYFDDASRALAVARAACLGAQLRFLSELTGIGDPQPHWSDAVLSSDPHYIAPHGSRRWLIPTDAGAPGPTTDRWFLITLPHEQAHRFQTRNGAVLPRWFEEGHAEWVGRKVSERIAPVAAAVHAEWRAQALATSTQPVALPAWGGMGVSREAIRRQASPEDRARMDADTNYVPRGPFSFGPNDLVSDESNTDARYEAAWRLLHDVESAAGSGAVRRLAAHVTSSAGDVSTADILSAAQSVTGVAIPTRLE